MDKLILLALALCGVGVVVAGTRPPAVEGAAVAPLAMTGPPAAPAPATAYRPGEPSLSLGDAATLTRGPGGHFSATVGVDGQQLDMVVDTGASAVALTVADAQRLGIVVDPTQFRVVGTGASGPVRGVAVTLDDVSLGERHVAGVGAVVVEGLDRSLLGQTFLGRLERVAIDGDRMTLR